MPDFRKTNPMAPGIEDISLVTAANNLTEAANTWLRTGSGAAGLCGIAMVIAGLRYAHRRAHDPRLSVTPVLSLWLGGGALVWAALWLLTVEVTLFQTDATFVYHSSGHHDWEARLFIATQAVVRLIGVCTYFWGLGTLALVGLDSGGLGTGRLSRGLLRTLFGLLLTFVGLVLTAILHTFGLPSPFVPQ
jgi:hypothetical protein